MNVIQSPFLLISGLNCVTFLPIPPNMDVQSIPLPELIIKLTHIACGGISLLAGVASMISKKGRKLHVWSGRVYFYAMLVVFLTSIYMSIIYKNPFLLMVGVFSFYLIFSGYRSLKHRQIEKDKAGIADWIGLVLAGAFSVGLLGFGIYTLADSGNGFGVVALVFALLGGFFVWGNLRTFLKGPRYKMAWLAGHIAGMVGGYIATLTAFLVTNVDFLPSLVIWLGPTLIGTPLIILWSRKFAPRPKKTSPTDSV